MKDKTRKFALNEIKVHARAILIMVEEYGKEYKNTKNTPTEVMENLDEIWRVITFNTNKLVEKVEKEDKP